MGIACAVTRSTHTARTVWCAAAAAVSCSFFRGPRNEPEPVDAGPLPGGAGQAEPADNAVKTGVEKIRLIRYRTRFIR
jgi:hypothetical protein